MAKNNSNPSNNLVKKSKTLDELNIIMSEQIDALLSGERPVAVAEATTNTIGKMFTGVKLQLEYARLIGSTPKIDMLMGRQEEK